MNTIHIKLEMNPIKTKQTDKKTNLLLTVVFSFMLRHTVCYYFFCNIYVSHFSHIGKSVENSDFYSPCRKHLPDRIISLKGQVRFRKTSLTHHKNEQSRETGNIRHTRRRKTKTDNTMAKRKMTKNNLQNIHIKLKIE
jgi:hypothetical protein